MSGTDLGLQLGGESFRPSRLSLSYDVLSSVTWTLGIETIYSVVWVEGGVNQMARPPSALSVSSQRSVPILLQDVLKSEYATINYGNVSKPRPNVGTVLDDSILRAPSSRTSFPNLSI